MNPSPTFPRRSLLVASILALAAALPPLRAADAPQAAEARHGRYEIPATDEGLPGSGPIRRFD